MVPTRRLPPGCTLVPGNNTFQINILWAQGGWSIGYPIIPDDTDGSSIAPFKPGHMSQWTTMPLAEFLNMLADEYKLPYVFIANIDNNK